MKRIYDIAASLVGLALGAALCTAFNPNTRNIVNNGLILWLRMSEGTGTSIADSSGLNQTFVMASASPSWTPTAPPSVTFSDPYSLRFTGNNQYAVGYTSQIESLNNFSMTTWIYPNASPAPSTRAIPLVIEGPSGGAQYLEYNNNNGGFLGFGGSSYYTGASRDRCNVGTMPTINAWHHLAFVRDTVASKLTIYVDGASGCTVNLTSSTANFGTGLLSTYIGGDGASGTLNGLLNDVRFYSRALSAAEISGLYGGSIYLGSQNSINTLTSIASQEGLVGWWKLGAAVSPSNIPDYSQYKNDIILASPSPSPTTDVPTVSFKLGSSSFFASPQALQLSANAVNQISGLNAGSISLWFKTSHTYSGSSDIGSFVVTSDATSNNLIQFLYSGDQTGSFADESIGFALFRGGVQKIGMYLRKGTNFYSDGAWHNVILVIGNGANTMYVDGVDLTASISYTVGSATTNEFTSITSPNTGRIGSRKLATEALYFQGNLSDVRIYNKPLTKIDATNIYNGQLATYLDVRNSGSGLSAWWPLENGSGTTASDISGQGFNGTLAAAASPTPSALPSWAPGISGKGLNFNNGSSYVALGLPFGSSSSGTKSICTWLNFSSVSGTQYIATNIDGITSTGYGIRIASGIPTITWDGTLNLITSPTTLSASRWYFICAVFDSLSSVGRIYINGALDKQASLPVEATNTNNNKLGGRWTSATSNGTGNIGNFLGTMDEVRFWNRVLGQNEIAEMYNQKKGFH